MMTRVKRVYLKRAPDGPGAGRLDKRPPPRLIDERNRRMAYVDTPNIVVLGDPPPGRSALDQRGQR